jgi:hypothetical protein
MADAPPKETVPPSVLEQLEALRASQDELKAQNAKMNEQLMKAEADKTALEGEKKRKAAEYAENDSVLKNHEAKKRRETEMNATAAIEYLKRQIDEYDRLEAEEKQKAEDENTPFVPEVEEKAERDSNSEFITKLQELVQKKDFSAISRDDQVTLKTFAKSNRMFARMEGELARAQSHMEFGDQVINKETNRIRSSSIPQAQRAPTGGQNAASSSKVNDNNPYPLNAVQNFFNHKLRGTFTGDYFDSSGIGKEYDAGKISDSKQSMIGNEM